MTIMEDIHDKERELDLNNEKFLNSEEVTEKNKRAVQKFCDKCFAEGLSDSRVGKYISNFHTVFKIAGKNFDLLSAEQEDIEAAVAKIERSDYAEATKADFKLAIKKFYKTIEGNGTEYPEKVAFIDTTRDKRKQEMPDILDKDEIDSILQACKNDRDRAMYKVLYEGGLRAGELMALRIRDVEFVNSGVRLNVRGKTGNRKILVVESERYLRSWLNKHPFPNRRNAPLWMKIRPTGGDASVEEMTLSYDYMRINLKRKATDAGVRPVTKDSGKESSEIYPHLLRHSRATHLATELTEAAMKEYFGWTQNSDMPQVYIHLSGRDIDKEIMQHYGIEEEDKVEKKECPRCSKTYKGRDSFCPRCGSPFSMKAASKAEETRESLDKIAKALVNGEIDKQGLQSLADEVG